MAAMGTEVHSLYGIQYCHLMYYEDVKVNAYDCNSTVCIIIIITLCSIMIFTIKEMKSCCA